MTSQHHFHTPASSRAQIQARSQARTRRKALALGLTVTAMGAMALAAAAALLAPGAEPPPVGTDVQARIDAARKAAIAPAVERPMPGKAASSAAVAGKCPPCTCTTCCAQRCRLRARL